MSAIDSLTPRQKEILRLLLKGYDAKSAARELSISVHTVNEHLKEARRLLGVSSSREAARILAETEALTPNSVGPDEMGVGSAPAPPASPQRSKAGLRLAIVGGVAMLAGLIALMLGMSSFDDGRTPAKSTISSRAEQNPSPYEMRESSPGTFDEISVSGPFKVLVFVGKESKIATQGPPELTADTLTTVDKGALSIRFRDGATWSWNPGSGMNVVIETPRLNAVRIQGAALVEVYGVSADAFAASTGGSGSIDLKELRARTVNFATQGAGGITAEGEALEAVYAVGGAGSIDAKRLRVGKAAITVNGAGSAFADVSDTATVAVLGNGRVQVVGGANCVKRPASSPRVECR